VVSRTSTPRWKLPGSSTLRPSSAR